MWPVVDCTGTYLYVQTDSGKEKTGYSDYTIRPGSGFGAGKVAIANVKFDLDPLRNAAAKDRADPQAVNFRYDADLTADKDLKSSFVVLTFVAQGSVGTWFVPIGHLAAGTVKHVSVGFHDRVDSVGRLHVFAQGAEVKSTQVPEAYDVRADYAAMVQAAGPSALELLKINNLFPYVLSRDGRLLATLRDRETYRAIVVYDLRAGRALHEQRTEDLDTTITGITWVSDHELVYLATSGWIWNRYRWFRARSELMLFDVRTGVATKLDDKVDGIIESLREHPDTLVLAQSGSFYKFDIRTRRSWDLENPEGGRFAFDSRGNTRIEFRPDGVRQQILYRPQPGAGWKDLDASVKTPGLRFSYGAKDALNRVATIMAIGADGDTLYISSRLHSDTYQLEAFSMSEGVVKQVVATLPNYDLTDSDNGIARLLFRKGSAEVIGMVYQAERPGVIWLDAKYKEVQRTLDAALPDHVNLPVDWSEDASTFIYLSLSDRDPGTFYIFHPEAGVLMPLQTLSDRLKGRQLAVTQPFDFKARDGATIHAYLTYPPAATAPVPLVVDIHGGPMLRDQWGFDPERQFLAGRGYAVLQVNFRGSSGFGAKYQADGLKSRLDTVVIDDIADGTRQVIQQGRVDPARVAVIGGSFGGWATYMSLIRYPELYRAGVVIAGVAHWRNLLERDRWRAAGEGSYVFLKNLLDGQDFKADEPQIDPYLRAAEIKQPIYILHGENDPVVDVQEATMMVKKLQTTNPRVEFLLFPNTGHTAEQWSFIYKVRRLNETASFLDRQFKAQAGGMPVALAAPAPVAADGR